MLIMNGLNVVIFKTYIAMFTGTITLCKSVQIRSFFWSVFSCICTEYGVYGVNLRIQSECRKTRTSKKSVFGHFLRSETLT